MKSRLAARLILIASFILVISVSLATTPGTSLNFQLVGQNPFFNRGMNAALAIFNNFVYVGSRTDGSSSCGVDLKGKPISGSCPHVHPGVLIVDVKNPASPTVVGEIGSPNEGVPFLTPRELRVIPNQNLLLVMNFQCSPFIHACQQPVTAADFAAASVFNIDFYDLSDPTNPQLVSSYVPTSAAGRHVKPHEMFLWQDPNNEDRVLLWMSTPTIGINPARPNLIITDISQARQGIFTELAEGNWNSLYPGTSQSNYPFDPTSADGCGPYDCNLFVHSMSTTPDGTRTFMALEAGHFLVLDTSSVVNNPTPGVVQSLNNSLLTNPTNRPVWLQNPPSAAAVPFVAPNGCGRVARRQEKDCPNSHSAVKVPGRALALTTDEVYGTFTFSAFGCRWGWERLIDVSDPAHPFIVGEYEIAENQLSFCGTPADDSLTEQVTSYSSHNPTVLPDIAIVDWHSGGVQVSDISNPANPVQAGFFLPTPLESVATEDPALSRGPNKVVMWSYPIIKNGLIYVVDIRNGLYILKYTGPFADEVKGIGFLEGNSNLGDAVDLDQNQQ